MDAGIVQIIVAIIGASTPIILQLIEEKETQVPDKTVKSEQSQIARIRIDKSRSLLDLSIIFLYAAFFSAILADSLLVSGRLPTLGIVVLLQIFFITLCITLVLAFAWYWRRGELAVGILSFTTLIVLIISPGGPFNPTSGEGEAALSLLLPVFVLSLLSTSSAIYFLGNPLARNTLPKSRRKAILFLSLLLCIGALTLGKQFVIHVSQDSRTPQFKGSSKEIHLAEQVLSEARKRNLRERGLFYKLGSEIVLSKFYLDSYFQVLSSLDFSNISEYVNSKDKTVKKDSEKNSPQRIKVLKSLAKFFSSNPPSLQLSYLSDRLRWVHPTVLDGNAQLNLPLPGTTVKERFEELTNYRIFHSMSGQQNLLDRFFELFKYDSDIVEAFDDLRADKSSKIKLIPQYYRESKESRFDKITRQTWTTLFPDLPPQAYTDLLRQQLAFPEPDELFVAYSTYGDLAPFFENKLIQNAKNLFDKLKPENQRAFITYITNENASLENYKVFANLANILIKNKEAIPNLGNSLSAATDLAGFINSTNNNSTQNANIDNIYKLADIIKKIFQNDADSKQRFADILQKENPQIPIINILNNETFKFINYIHQKLPDGQKKKLFALLRDPVTPTIKKMAVSLTPYKEQNWIKKELDNFIKLTPANREAVLHHLAIATYRAEGEHSLRPIQLLVFQAHSLSYWLAFLCSTILFLPIVSSAIFIGGFLGRKLVERDRIRDLIITEQSNQKEFGATHAIGIPVELQGRQRFIDKLRSLSGRGWSTIAVVGRRGIGKSRILHELYQPSSKSSRDYGISVWISAPSQYEEEDFIESVLEQFTSNTEKAVARYLGAEPFAVRQLEALLAQSGLLIFVIAIFILAFMWSIIYQRLLRPEVVISWFPILLVVVASATFLVRHLAHLQPVDLSPWLESDRTHSPHTVLLYRRVQKALKFLRSRKTAMNTQGIPIAGGGIVMAAAWAVIAICVMLTVFIVICFTISITSYSGGQNQIRFWFFFLSIFLLCSTIFSWMTRRERRVGRRASLMSLIAEYRNFAETIVYRLEQGALGGKMMNVMICIDELDKIIELEEVRDFLRRMKGIFEVPGVYYYLSLSEDALAALYLGSAEGKNEVDSSLDHIVRIPPLSWEEAQEVATAYLKRRQVQQLDSKMLDALVAASFGVPRDILRRFDELLARKDAYNTNPQQLVYEFRKDQVEIASQIYEWSRQQYEAMLGEPVQSALDIKSMIEGLKNETSKLRESRVLSLIWILCCIECANNLEDQKRIDFLKILHDMGYRLALKPLSDLIDEMDKLDTDFVVHM